LETKLEKNQIPIEEDQPLPGRQLLIALRLYAVGTFHDVTGEMAGYSKSHISVIITRVSHILSSMVKDFVKFPTPEEALEV